MAHEKPRYGKMSIGSMAVTAAVVLAVMIWLVWSFGGVSGEEFAPQKFTIRRFRYFQIPFLRMQIWPISFSKVGGKDDELAKYIRSNRLVGGVSAQPVRWDIVTMDEIGRASFRGDASILTNYLRQPGAAGTESWLDWSQKKPKLAAQLWPMVARVAHEKMYVLVPELLEAARRAESEDAFEATVRSLVGKELRLFAKAEQQRGDTKRAKQLTAIARELETSRTPQADAKDEPTAEADPEDASYSGPSGLSSSV